MNYHPLVPQKRLQIPRTSNWSIFNLKLSCNSFFWLLFIWLIKAFCSQLLKLSKSKQSLLVAQSETSQQQREEGEEKEEGEGEREGHTTEFARQLTDNQSQAEPHYYHKHKGVAPLTFLVWALHLFNCQLRLTDLPLWLPLPHSIPSSWLDCPPGWRLAACR